MWNCHFSSEKGEIDDSGETALRHLDKKGKEANVTLNGAQKMDVQCILKILTLHGLEGTNHDFSRMLYLKILGWLGTAIMALAAGGMLLASGK
jgi:hypothetical protein